MLWVDKHRPTSLETLDYGKEQANQLRELVSALRGSAAGGAQL